MALGILVIASISLGAVWLAVAGLTLLLAGIVILLLDIRRRLGDMEAERLDAVDRQREILDELAPLSEAIQAGQSDQRSAFDDLVNKLDKERVRRRRSHDELLRFGRDQTREVEALLQLFQKIKPRAPMPSSGHWALDPTGILQLTALVEQQHPSLVVELGSGTSSVWLGYMMESIGVGRVVSLEHDGSFATRSRALVEAHGLTEMVEIRDAALEPLELDGRTYSWYNAEAMADLKDIDLLIVDGPPGSTGPKARYPALPALVERLSDGALVVMDDATRDDESKIVNTWCLENPGLHRLLEILGNQAILKFRRLPD